MTRRPLFVLCQSCGFQGAPVTREPSFLLGLILLCLFILPGLLYFAWRQSAIRRVCPACDAPTIIPLDSPVAQQYLAQQSRQR